MVIFAVLPGINIRQRVPAGQGEIASVPQPANIFFNGTSKPQIGVIFRQ
jgi:hypothetical protein